MSVKYPGAGLRRAAALALLAVALPAAAQWTGKGEAGFAVTSGNSDTRTANAKIAVSRKVDAWEHTGRLAGLYVRNDGQTSARRWEAGEQTHYGFGSGRTFWFGGGRYEKDRFSGFAYQGILNTGIGHKFTDTETTKFSVLIGAGYKFVEILGTPDEKDNSAVGTAGLEYSRRLTATTTLVNKFGAEFAADNNFLQNELGLSVKVSDRLALAVGYALRHNTAPPAGFKKTDKQSTVNLVYEVK
jgi:putative salt-induced outer membrane protein